MKILRGAKNTKLQSHWIGQGIQINKGFCVRMQLIFLIFSSIFSSNNIYCISLFQDFLFVPQFYFHISDWDDDDTNDDAGVGFELSKLFISFISTKVFFISWSFVFRAFDFISSLVIKGINCHDDDHVGYDSDIGDDAGDDNDDDAAWR